MTSHYLLYVVISSLLNNMHLISSVVIVSVLLKMYHSCIYYMQRNMLLTNNTSIAFLSIIQLPFPIKNRHTHLYCNLLRQHKNNNHHMTFKYI